MKTKLEMAHDYAMKHTQEGWDINYDVLVVDAWAYADAMQAEADKREKEQQGEHVFEAIEEWQPDWSQAPATADIWKKSSADNYYWYCGDTCLGKAPSFGYTGDWRESLRKRPE